MTFNYQVFLTRANNIVGLRSDSVSHFLSLNFATDILALWKTNLDDHRFARVVQLM